MLRRKNGQDVIKAFMVVLLGDSGLWAVEAMKPWSEAFYFTSTAAMGGVFIPQK